MSDDDPLLADVLVPLASEDDAAATADAAFGRIAATGGRATAVYVVEKAGGAPDVASVEQREEYAEDIFAVAEERAASAGVPLETDVVYGTDVVAAILAAAADIDATAVVFTPREGSRWLDLLTGDVAHDLIKEADRPVVVFPAVEEDATRGAADE